VSGSVAAAATEKVVVRETITRLLTDVQESQWHDGSGAGVAPAADCAA
jgi:hypothetical protein